MPYLLYNYVYYFYHYNMVKVEAEENMLPVRYRYSVKLYLFFGIPGEGHPLSIRFKNNTMPLQRPIWKLRNSNPETLPQHCQQPDGLPISH